jgi:predicted methyltransferase MtxX (methanogen marker protein 4)
MQKEFLIALISDNNINNISKALGILENLKDADTIVIDNGSSYNLIDEIEDYKSTK